MWDQAQTLRKKNIHGIKRIDGQQLHPKHRFPNFNLGGLILCGHCGQRLTSHVSTTTGKRSFYCKRRADANCEMRFYIQADHIERALFGLLAEVCTKWPEWLRETKAEIHRQIQQLSTVVPAQTATLEKALKDVNRKIDNLITQLSEMDGKSPRMTEKLRELEAQSDQLRHDIASHKAITPSQFLLPTDEEMESAIAKIPEMLAVASPETAALLKRLFSKITMVCGMRDSSAESIAQLRLRFSQFELLAAGIPAERLTKLRRFVTGADAASEEFVVDVTPPPKIDEVGPRIHELKESGSTWQEISQKMSMSRSACVSCYKKWRKKHGRYEHFVPIWKSQGARIHELRQTGTSWTDISAQLGMKIKLAQKYWNRWKEFCNVKEPPPSADPIGPQVHELRLQNRTFPQIAAELKLTLNCIYFHYYKWLGQTGTTPPEVLKWKAFGPEVDRLRKKGFTWREIEQKLGLPRNAPFSHHHRWLKETSVAS